MPDELLLVHGALRDHLGDGEDRDSDFLTQLHARANRLALTLGPTLQPDERLQTALRMILNASARLQTGGGLEALLESLNTYAREITGAERTCVVLLGPSAERTVQITSTPPTTERLARGAAVSHTVIQRVISTRTPLLLHDVFGDTELMERPSITSMALRSVLCVPMLRGPTLFGVMYADSSAGAGTFDKVDLEILSLFAEQAAAAIETSRLLADVQRSYSELKATQERLIRGERLRVMGEMTSGVAHDFNNLLTAILARIQLLNLGYLAPEVRESLALIEKAALDAAEVVRRLQGFARARREAGFTRMDMSDLCADVVELLRPLWSARRRHGKAPISVRLRASKGLYVSGDPTELREILTNLLKNSLDALEGGGTIVISADIRDGRVRVEVVDDGPGISKELQGKLFQPFFTTKGERGTGLGLCLSLQIAERHGGDLRLRSAEGAGTTATLELPQAAPQRAALAPEASDRAPTAEPGTSVLVVDDDPDVRTPLCAYLQRSGFSVDSAGSAADGLAHVQDHLPDLIISDIVMPGIDGIELCRRIKASNPNLPVVLMSGQASAIDPTIVQNAGATALLAKPFTMRQVLDLAANLTRKNV
jgi:signal transduction histidine kinase